VRPCVLREEQKQAAGVAAPSVPKDASPAPDAPLEIRTSFVAPPRTIADITAILDSEKPDEAQIAKRKATADASSGGLTGPKLAEFLFDRGLRACLARAQQGRARRRLASARHRQARNGFAVLGAHPAIGRIAIPGDRKSKRRDRDPASAGRRRQRARAPRHYHLLAASDRANPHLGRRRQPGECICRPRRGDGLGGARQSQS
jgi:hypothetical protein